MNCPRGHGPLLLRDKDGERMERTASLSDCGTYRWTLTRGWASGSTVCWIMLNPSTADAEQDDPTIRSIIKRSQAWGYGSLVVVNSYPFRSSHPQACAEWLKSASKDVLAHNLFVMKTEMDKADLIVAAWGNAGWLPAEDTSRYDLYCIGTNANGTPKHPLARGKHRVPEDTEPQLWRAAL